jgi:hypothetical protein
MGGSHDQRDASIRRHLKWQRWAKPDQREDVGDPERDGYRFALVLIAFRNGEGGVLRGALEVWGAANEVPTGACIVALATVRPSLRSVNR